MKGHLFRSIFILIALGFITIQSAVCQSYSYGMVILTEYSSMRSKAMGYSTVAMEGYPGAAQINPASIGLNDMVQGSTYLFDKKGSLFGRNIIGFNLFQPNLDVKIKKWGLAAYMTYFDLGKVVSTDNKGNLLTRSHSYEQAVSLSGSYELSSFFSIGLGMHFLTDKPGTSSITVGNINDPAAHSFAVDLGVLYKKTYNLTKVIIKPSAGWSLTNFGSMLHYYHGQSDPLPMAMQGGLGLRVVSKDEVYHRPLISVGLYASLSHILARVDGNGNSYGPFEALVRGWSPFEQKDFSSVGYRLISFTDQFFTHIGLEETLLGVLSFRVGYINRPTALNYSNVKSFGIGLDLYYASLDYTYFSGDSYLPNSRSIWQVNLRLPLSSHKDRGSFRNRLIKSRANI